MEGRPSVGMPQGRRVLLYVVVGVVAGLGGIVFQVADQTVHRFTSQGIAGFAPPEAAGESSIYAPATGVPFSPLLLLAVMAAGGLAAGWLVQTYAPEAEGHGTDAVIEAYHERDGAIRPVVPVVKLLASALTIGTSGSGGREGPIAQIGAGFGSYLATLLKLPVSERRLLLAAGMGAGIGAVFRAPLAGAMFAAEIMYRDSDSEAEVVLPTAIASTVAFSVFSCWLPPEQRFNPLFGGLLHYQLAGMAELLPMILLAVVLAATGFLHVKLFYGLHGWMKRRPLPPLLKPVLGAVAAGLAMLGLYYASNRDPNALTVAGVGYGILQKAFVDPAKIGVAMLLAVAVLKSFATAATIGSGGSGGVFGPSIVVGGCLGGAVGTLLHAVMPGLVPQPAVYAILGMAGFFAGVARAPLATVVMVAEITGDYGLLIPSLWVSTLCFLMLPNTTRYVKQVAGRRDSPVHRDEAVADLLDGLRVRDLELRPGDPLLQNAPQEARLAALAQSRERFPVVDADGRLLALLSPEQLRERQGDPLLAAADLPVGAPPSDAPLLSTTLDDDLHTVLRRCADSGLEYLPVVDSLDGRLLLGFLSKADVVARCTQALLSRRREAESE